MYEGVQLTFDFECSIEKKVELGEKIQLLPLDEYDHVLISFSTGKDSVGCLLFLLKLGVDKKKIELWHQCVDGYGDTYKPFMDWPITEAYAEAISDHFGIPVYYQWRENGFKGELLRKQSLTGDVFYINEHYETIRLPTKGGKLNTRMRWPATGADLRTRWCSAYLKIDVFRRVLNRDPRFIGKKVLVVTGERREESSNRAKYQEMELHACHSSKRLVHAWRPVIDWREEQIWDLYEEHRILPHPAYLLGWNRTSCFGCIFTSKDYWAMMREIAPDRFYELARLEKELNHTIDPKLTLEEKANMGSIDRLPKSEHTSAWVNLALSRSFKKEDLIVENWSLPAGAFRKGMSGPV